MLHQTAYLHLQDELRDERLLHPQVQLEVHHLGVPTVLQNPKEKEPFGLQLQPSKAPRAPQNGGHRALREKGRLLVCSHSSKHDQHRCVTRHMERVIDRPVQRQRYRTENDPKGKQLSERDANFSRDVRSKDGDYCFRQGSQPAFYGGEELLDVKDVESE